MNKKYALRASMVSEEDIEILRAEAAASYTQGWIKFYAEAWNNGIVSEEGASVPPTEEIYILKGRNQAITEHKKGRMLVCWPGTQSSRIMDCSLAEYDLIKGKYNEGCGTESWRNAINKK
jgi:hypothetical protein